MAKLPGEKLSEILCCEELEQRLLLSADVVAALGSIAADEQVLVFDVTDDFQADGEIARQAVDQTVAESRRELVFVNGNVTGYEQLIAGLREADGNRDLEVVVLASDRDGIEQVSGILLERSDLAGVHFITHGSDGQINLGNGWLNGATLQQERVAVSGWGRAMAETGDLLFYGCNIAAGSKGQDLLEDIANLTGADVAASDDVTGSAQLGGDWDLEYRAGVIDAGAGPGVEARTSWDGTLAAPVIGGDSTGAVIEDDNPDLFGLLNATGTLTIVDPDPGESSFQAEVIAGIHGNFAIDAAGDWGYSADNVPVVIQQLDAGESVTDTLTVTTADGTPHDITITINGVEDAPTLGNGIVDQAATEDAAFSFTFAANTFSDVDASDTLIYTATLDDDSALPAWLTLNAGTRTFSGTPANDDVGSFNVKVKADDGTSAAFDTFAVTVINTDDAPVIGGDGTGAVTEDVDSDADTLLEATGRLTISDPDAGESSFRAGTIAGTYGDLTINRAGGWGYSADNTQTAIQQLDDGESVSDTLTVTTADGTRHDLTITINGAEDAPILVNAIGDRTVDEDAAFSLTFAANTFSEVDASDTLAYTATLDDDSALPAWLTFNAATRTFSGIPANDDVGSFNVKVKANDGTSAAFDTFAVTVINTDDAPVIGGDGTGSVTEDVDPDGDTLLEAAGRLTISDPDVGESSFRAGTTAGSHGELTIDEAGAWGYSADNSRAAIQQLDAGETLTDTLSVTTADGTAHDVEITIIGAEDVPVFTSIALTEARENAAYRYTITADDVDGDGLIISAANLPAWLSLVDHGDGTATLSGTPSPAEVGDHGVVLEVSDGDSTGTQIFNIYVSGLGIAGPADKGDPDDNGEIETVEEESSEAGGPSVEETAVAESPAEVEAVPPLEEVPAGVDAVESGEPSVPVNDPEAGNIDGLTLTAHENDMGTQPEGREDDRPYTYFDNELYKEMTSSENLALKSSAAENEPPPVSGDDAIVLDFDSDIASRFEVNGEYDLVRQEIDEAFNAKLESLETREKVATIATGTITLGIGSYLLRAGSLVASLRSTLPLWRGFDPITIFSAARKKVKDSKKGPDTAEPESETIFDGDKQ